MFFRCRSGRLEGWIPLASEFPKMIWAFSIKLEFKTNFWICYIHGPKMKYMFYNVGVGPPWFQLFGEDMQLSVINNNFLADFKFFLQNRFIMKDFGLFLAYFFILIYISSQFL